MTDFEGINPYAYQKAAVEYQKQRVAEQPQLKPQIEKVANLPPIKSRGAEPTVSPPTSSPSIGREIGAGRGSRSKWTKTNVKPLGIDCRGEGEEAADGQSVVFGDRIRHVF
jgi:hypothetical protein